MSGILCPGSGIRKCWHYREIVMIVWHAYLLIPHAWGKADSLSEQVTFRFTMLENRYRQTGILQPGPFPLLIASILSLETHGSLMLVVREIPGMNKIRY
jgi:hypothetical protein